MQNDYLLDEFSSVLFDFTKVYKKRVYEFISGYLTCMQLSRLFIDYIADLDIEVSSNKVLDSLEEGELKLDKIIRSRICKPFKNETVNLLGFGLASGEYEIKLANYILSQQYCKHIKIFGYDPFVQTDNNQINYITLADFNKKQIPKFDIILSRWSLHHVQACERWMPLLSLVNHVNLNAHIFIVEEGPFLLNDISNNRRITLLFQVLEDAFVNYILFPRWCCSNNYYIEYLSENDIERIESNLSFEYAKNSISLPGNEGTQIINYYNTR
ncbi:hypothetical protein KJ708_05245 [bacterium]|nr:hypothetical protein [bacterium]MBU1916909.1 hypothetical protein [bacterium]